jgi:hypothetical protein
MTIGLDEDSSQGEIQHMRSPFSIDHLTKSKSVQEKRAQFWARKDYEPLPLLVGCAKRYSWAARQRSKPIILPSETL